MEYYFYTDLIRLGFTPRLIAQFFDPPDKYVDNPRNPNWASMKLYEKRRVERTYLSDAFLKEYVKLDDLRIKRKNATAR